MRARRRPRRRRGARVRPRAGRRSTGSPALAAREPWRLFSAAFVHYSTLHLLANLAGAALVGALGFFARVPRRVVLAWLVAWPLTAARPAGATRPASLRRPLGRAPRRHRVRRRAPDRERARTAARDRRLAARRARDQGPQRDARGARRCAIPPAGTSPPRRSRTPAGLVAGVLAAVARRSDQAPHVARRRKGTPRSPPLPCGGRAGGPGSASATQAPPRRPRRHRPRPLLLSLGPEPGRREGGAARGAGALAGDGALGGRGGPGLGSGRLGAASRSSSATARFAAACSPARSSAPSSSASSSACSSRPHRAWSSSSTSRRSSSLSACR